MLYEDTSKPVPGLAEIQTSTKPKGKRGAAKELSPKVETKEPALSPLEPKTEEAQRNGKYTNKYMWNRSSKSAKIFLFSFFFL